MAWAQTQRVIRELQDAHPVLLEKESIEVVPIVTTADKVQDRLLADIGGKQLFTKEIEEALLAKTIDMAVHSMKDVPTQLPAGLEVACILKRDDPRDALISRNGSRLKELSSASKVGTSSLRRKAQLLHRFPSLQIVQLRGNANTRLRKLEEGTFDATLLAFSGLIRIAREDTISEILSIEEMLPAVGQGALGVEIRVGDEHTRRLLLPLKDRNSELCLLAERSLLRELDGSCHTPIAGLAVVESDGNLSLRGILATPDGDRLYEEHVSGTTSDALEIGRELGRLLRRAE